MRNPLAERYTIFQDDVVAVTNLRQYLESSKSSFGPKRFPNKGYLNLYTFPPERQLAPPTEDYVGWYKSNQLGKSACGLVFDRNGVQTILKSRHVVLHPTTSEKRRHRSIDGVVCKAMEEAGYTEYVHSPSLLQHCGYPSSIDSPRAEKPHAQATAFPGQEFDAMSWVF